MLGGRGASATSQPSDVTADGHRAGPRSLSGSGCLPRLLSGDSSRKAEDAVHLVLAQRLLRLSRGNDQVGGQADLLEELRILQRDVQLVVHDTLPSSTRSPFRCG